MVEAPDVEEKMIALRSTRWDGRLDLVRECFRDGIAERGMARW
jgi:hypothetical protein